MRVAIADMAQVVEHVLGKDEVTSSNLVISSRTVHSRLLCTVFLINKLFYKTFIRLDSLFLL